MPKTVKVKNVTWESFGGGLCVIIHSDDGTSIAVPASAIWYVHAEARRRLAAEKTKNEKSQMPPPWHHVNFLPAQTMTVRTTDDGKVGIILDLGLETEFALSISAEHARELGRQLIAQADQASGLPPKMN
jgi:hypothetical protein